jgi:octaprenyl-diphosphate synthase
MAELRRDRPTINALSNNSKAILSGDFLVARVIRELSDVGAHQQLRDMSEVMEYLVYGEWLQEGSRRQVDVPMQRLRQIAEFKTASLLGWCCMVPARLKKADEELAILCKELGVALGISFQLVDDVIDWEVGGQKEYARDIKNGFMNFVTWELVQQNPLLAAQVQDFLDGKGAPDPKWQAEEIEAAKDRVRKRSQDELNAAREKLQQILDRALGPRQNDNIYAQSLVQLIDLMSLRQV